MRYRNVCIETFGYTLPDEVVTSRQIEERLAPLYGRLRLADGRLELMTGIRERRFWPCDMLPSTASIASARQAIEAACVDPRHIGALVHASVCRDHLEPATACRVHHRLGLPPECLVYDVSNACLGILDGMLHVANMIELGQIRAGLVVGSENGRPLVETTIERLNADRSITRETLKPALASLTIGSGSAAVLLVDRELSRTSNRLLAAVARADTRFHGLCQSGRDEAAANGMRPMMQTESEELMHEGVRAANRSFEDLLAEVGWTAQRIDKTFCHQVGAAHRKLMLQTLGLPLAADFATVEHLGNTGSVALPLSAALGIEQGHLEKDDRVAMLGIGSGINTLMLAVDWQCSLAETVGSVSADAVGARGSVR